MDGDGFPAPLETCWRFSLWLGHPRGHLVLSSCREGLLRVPRERQATGGLPGFLDSRVQLFSWPRELLLLLLPIGELGY